MATRLSRTYGTTAFILALNYFAFQVELFEDEYEANHPRSYTTSSISQPSVTWESFDKENAPKAFVCKPFIQLSMLYTLAVTFGPVLEPGAQFQPVRDKSPPPLNCTSL